MTTAVQHRRGTTAEHSTFTGLEGELTIDTTKDTAVIHDGTLAGGYPLAKENLANVTTSGLSSIDGASTASDDKFFIYDQSATALKTITRAELNNAMEQDALANVAITGGTINGTAIGGTTAAAGAFTTLTTSSTVTLNGGTANGVAYLNGSKVLTTGSALTFDGTKQTISANANAAPVELLRLNNIGSGDLTQAQITFYAAGTNYAVITGGYAGAPSLISNVANTGYHAWQVATNEQMRLTSTGLGIGTSSPGVKLDVNGAARIQSSFFVYGTGDRLNVFPQAAGSGVQLLVTNNANSAYAPLTLDGSATIFNASGGEQMRLTSTGLGIGTSSPSFKLDVTGSAVRVKSASAYSALLLSSDDSNASTRNWAVASSYNNYGDLCFVQSASQGGNPIGGTVRAALDSSGNLGLGVTPSAWGSTYRALQIATGSGAVSSRTDAFRFFASTNAYNDNTNWRYGASTFASLYEQGDSSHKWYTAPSGTAGNAISFTQAMTLDASGNLGIGTSSPTRKLDVVGNGYFSTGMTVADTSAVNWGAWTSIQENGFFDAGGNFLHNAVKTSGVNDTWNYRNNGFATRYKQLNAVHSWYFAASGTAGNAISWTQAMTLDASGNLGVGTTNPGSYGARFVNYSSTGSSWSVVASGANQLYMGYDSSIGANAIESNGTLIFATRPAFAESARIDSSGNLIQSAPTTPPSLATNGQMVFNLTSNTNLRVSVRGSDGVTRTANITLA